MKIMICLIIYLLITFSAFAGDGGTIGGAANAMKPFDAFKVMMSLDASKIIDIKTFNGDVITIPDLRDGYFKIEDVFLKKNKLFLKQNAPVLDMMLKNGQLIDFSTFSGGDIGGGGSNYKIDLSPLGN